MEQQASSLATTTMTTSLGQPTKGKKDNRETTNDHQSPSSPSISSPAAAALPFPPNRPICRPIPSSRRRRSQSDPWHVIRRGKVDTASSFPLRIQVRQVRNKKHRRVLGLGSNNADARLRRDVPPTLVLSAVSIRRHSVVVREIIAPALVTFGAVERFGEWDADALHFWASALFASDASAWAHSTVHVCRDRVVGKVVRGTGEGVAVNHGFVGLWRVRGLRKDRVLRLLVAEVSICGLDRPV
jgi:hypothetical protein